MAIAGGSSRRLRWVMVGSGLFLGFIFPFVALIFVSPRSTIGFAVFVGMCLGAGGFMGWLCDSLAERASQKAIAGALEQARTRLGVDIRVENADLDTMTAEFERVFRDVSGVLTRARMVNSELRALTAQALTATEEQASGAAEQAAAVTQTSATVEELAQTSRQIAENSQAVAAIAERTLASAEEGMSTVADTADGIEEIRESTQAASDRILALGERSQEIGRVLVIIDDIAEQTKILALNAAIEAARAGEAGKGFAVVAEEIRKLAESVTESTSEIGRVVREIQSSTASLVMSTEKASRKVDEGKVLAGHTAESLGRIVHQVEETTDSAKQISIATQQQRTASDQVVVSMREMAQVARQSAEASRQIQAAILELNELADSLDLR
ncbi:MAG: methyl-accepting chemotaxis protein [Coriobacteriia bacterium]|nr:methyl-accepting chemotaxis protein [Coriobacteriia bacterium]